MIGIKLQTGFLDLGENYQVNIDLVSPLFSDIIGYGSTSLKFTIPNNQHNRQRLQQIDALQKSGATYSQDCEIYLVGSPWREAKLNTESVSPRSFTISLDISESKVARELSENNIRDFTYTIDTVTAGADEAETSENVFTWAGNIALGNFAKDYHFFPIQNGNMHEDTLVVTGTSDYINYWHNNQFWDGPSYFANFGDAGIMNLIPFPKLKAVLEQALAEIGYTLADTLFTTDDELIELVIYNNVTLNISAAYFGNVINLKNHLPDVNARDFFRGINAMFGLAIILSETDSTIKLVDRNTVARDFSNQVDWREKCLDYVTSNEGEVNYTFSSEQDPDDRLLSNIQSPTPQNTVAGEVYHFSDLPGSPALGTVYYVAENTAYYRYNDLAAWEFFSYRVESKVVGTGSDAKSTIFSTLMMMRDRWMPNPVNNFWHVPRVDQYLTGVNPNSKTEKHDFSPRLLFYRGMAEADATYDYPQGSADDLDGTYDYSLYWHGENGLYEKWWKAWVEMLQTALPVSYQLLLNINDVSNIDWTAKYRLRDETGEPLALIRKLRVTFTPTGMQPVQADMLRIL